MSASRAAPSARRGRMISMPGRSKDSRTGPIATLDVPTLPSGTFSIAQAFVIGPPTPNGKLPLNFSNAVEVVIR